MAGDRTGQAPTSCHRILIDEPGERRESDLRILLVGKSGGGKSATGNSLLGRKEFESMLGLKTTTLTCQKGDGSWEGQAVSVIDTADIFDPESFNERSRQEIQRCINLSRPGPHALVLVTQVGRFTAEDEAAAKRVLDIFGTEAARHMIVLFTRKEDLGGASLRDYVQDSDNKALRWLVEKCGGRFCAFNNRAVGAERESQVSELMGLVQGVLRQSGGRPCSNDLYLELSWTDAKLKGFVEGNRRARERAEGAGIFAAIFAFLFKLAVAAACCCCCPFVACLRFFVRKLYQLAEQLLPFRCRRFFNYLRSFIKDK